jgi:CheY-like chemotaxis protein
VTAAEDGRNALEIAQRESFDFVVTDLAMPGLDGWELLDMLLRFRTPPRVIVITVQGEENCQRKVKERGGWAYVEKDCLIPGVREALKAASGE